MHSRNPNDPESERKRALSQIPGGLFVLTSHTEGRSAAVPARWVQQCSDVPPMLMVALSKGQPVEPLIRDSRSFVLCQIGADDRFLLRKFSQAGDHSDDPLVTMPTRLAPSGSPIIDRAMSFLDCEVVRHIELDCDYRIYVGQVHAGGLLNQSSPAISFGGNGAA